MSGRLRSLAGNAITRLLDRLSTPALERMITRLARRRVRSLEPDEALRFLFRLDAALYEMEGRAAIAYGDGLHTKHRHLHYHDFFVDRIGAGERVLDIGAGIGAVARAVAERSGAEVVALELVREKVQEARRRFRHDRVRYVHGDATESLPDGPFDVVLLSNVLEHLADRAAFLERTMAASGASRALVRVPLFERDWRVPLKRELGVEWRLDPTHETEYTVEQLRAELEEAGLAVRALEVRWGEIWAEASLRSADR